MGIQSDRHNTEFSFIQGIYQYQLTWVFFKWLNREKGVETTNSGAHFCWELQWTFFLYWTGTILLRVRVNLLPPCQSYNCWLPRPSLQNFKDMISLSSDLCFFYEQSAVIYIFVHLYFFSGCFQDLIIISNFE